MASTSFFDAPGAIRKEGNSQTLTFARNPDKTTGKLCWSPVPPTPTTGCGTPSGHYNGGVLIGSTSPITQLEKPKDGVCCYSGDPTMDEMMFAGDKIGVAKVLWSNNNDLTTSCIEIEGLDPNCTAYYFAFFAIDNTCRYNQEGIYSYSLDLKGPEIECTSGYIVISLNGAQPTDDLPPTFDSTINHPVGLRVDGNEINLLLDGSSFSNYNELVDVLNEGWKHTTPVITGQYPPAYGQFYTDGSQWYQFDGAKYLSVSPIVSSTDPTLKIDGDIWYNPQTGILSEYQGGEWNPVWQTVYKLNVDPTIPSNGTIWFDGDIARRFDGNVWIDVETYVQTIDPTSTPTLSTNTIWKNEQGVFARWNETRQCWKPASVLVYQPDPQSPTNGTLWYNPVSRELSRWNGLDWIVQPATLSANQPLTPTTGQIWINPINNVVKQYSIVGQQWTLIDVVVYHKALDDLTSGDLNYKPDTNQLFVYDGLAQQWINITGQMFSQPTDPNAVPAVGEQAIWINGSVGYVRSGSQWNGINIISTPDDPRLMVSGFWLNTTTNMWYERTPVGNWNPIFPTIDSIDPTNPVLGTTWFDGTDLHQRTDSTSWSIVPFTTTAHVNNVGDRWLDDVGTLRVWTGHEWMVINPPYVATINKDSCIVLTSTSCGGDSIVEFTDDSMFVSALRLIVGLPRPGNDGYDGVPMYDALGIGTDGSVDERRSIIDDMYIRLGAPQINVELSREQMNLAVQKALDLIRRDSGAGYKRGYFFLDLQPGQQHYVLTSKKVGFNKIVDIMYLYRPRGSFLNMTFGGGDIYGQQMLQQLYVSGTFDLLSYHLLASYQTLVAKLFATEFQFQWIERTRTLSLLRKIPRRERILVDAVIERTEQDLFTDRMTKNWIKDWALTEAKMMLGDMRGKFTSLPGAGGQITLNAETLKAEAQAKQDSLKKDLEDFIASDIETWGLGVMMVKG